MERNSRRQTADAGRQAIGNGLPSTARRPPPLKFYAGLALLALLLGATLAAPWLAPGDPLATDVAQAVRPPSPDHLLGTDALGRDVLSRLLWGGRATLGAAAGALALTLAIGAPLGLAAGFWGGWVDAVLMRLVDVLLAFPGLLLALGIVAILDPGPVAVIIAVGVAGAPGYARVARAAALEVRNQPYVQAAAALGASDLRLLVRHILPNALGPLLAFATVQLGWSLLNAAALSFLGLAGPPARPEWGHLLADGREHLVEAPWLSLASGLALTLTVLAANLIGDGLRERVA